MLLRWRRKLGLSTVGSSISRSCNIGWFESGENQELNVSSRRARVRDSSQAGGGRDEGEIVGKWY
jgi:hypothetical protein